jgi:hypothetical protein
MRRHMLALDYGLIGCAVLILATLAIPWYSEHFGPITVSADLLSGNGRVQCTLVPVIVGFLIAEVAANLVIFRLTDREWRYHRGAVFLLYLAAVIAVGSSAATPPFAPNTLENLGISLNPGLGAWIAVAGSVLGLVGAIGRGFASRPALTRTTPVRG